MKRTIRCVLFDLDGTVADTAADLAAPVQAMRIERGLPPMAFEELRPFASMGARGLIGKGLGIAKEEPAFPALRDEFLARYEANICVRTKLFQGMEEALLALDAKGITWGIVSNKIERYVRLVCEALRIDKRASCLVGGDSTPTPKPHPAPLLLGAQLSNVAPEYCLYVGDDHRDIEAGRAAGMGTVAAAYGYNGSGLAPDQWGADFTIHQAEQVLHCLSHS